MAYSVGVCFSNGEVDTIDVYPAANCQTVGEAIAEVNSTWNGYNGRSFDILYVVEG
jgi:hypothetical protein